MPEIAFIETNRAGNGSAAMRAGEALGFKSHFITCDLSQYDWMAEDDHPSNSASLVTVVETLSVRTILSALRGRQTATILAFDDDAVLLAAAARHELRLPYGPRLSALRSVRYKDQMRVELGGSVFSPRFRVFDPGHEPPPVEDQIFPCVLKPSDGSGSFGVTICQNADELLQSIDKLRYLPPSGVEKRPRRLILEQYVDGDQFSAELVWTAAEARWRLIGLTSTATTEGHSPVTLSCTYPARVEPQRAASAWSFLPEIMGRLALRETIVHLEFRLSRDGFMYVLDINPRPAGSRIRKLIELVHGFDVLSYAYILSHLGREAPLPQARLGCYASVGFLLPPPLVSVKGIRFPTPLSTQICQYGKIGQYPMTVPQDRNADHRVAFAVAEGSGALTAERTARSFLDGIVIEA